MTFDNLGEEDVRKTKINLYKLDMKIVNAKLRKNPTSSDSNHTQVLLCNTNQEIRNKT